MFGASGLGPPNIAVVERGDIFGALAAAFSTGRVEVTDRLAAAGGASDDPRFVLQRD
jgi:hypothetical protein